MGSAYEPDRYAIKSFIIVFFGGDDRELESYQVPLSVAAPFANRLFMETPDLPDWRTLREPWYTLAPRSADAHPFRRSTHPAGPTSLYGREYDPESDPESEPRVHLHPQARIRHFEVCLLDLKDELHRGEYSVDDIFLHGAHYMLRHRIERGEIPGDAGPYTYGIVPSAQTVSNVADYFPEDAYEVEGVFRLPPRVEDRARITFRPVKSPPLPELDPGKLGESTSHGKGEPQAGRVVMSRRVFDALRRDLELSDEREEGGYLAGQAYRAPGSPEKDDDENFRWVVEVTHHEMAKGTLGSAAVLLFTGDSWSTIGRRLDTVLGGRVLVGWFHTHLFGATDDFGLSGLDQDMHAWYLSKPWQVAILLNLEKDGERTVRCYQRGPEGDLVETPFEVLDE